MHIDGLSYLIVVVPLLTVLASAMWAYGDAKRRGKPAALVALLVVFGAWPMGLIAWLIFRPEVAGPARRRFNLEDFRRP